MKNKNKKKKKDINWSKIIDMMLFSLLGCLTIAIVIMIFHRNSVEEAIIENSEQECIDLGYKGAAVTRSISDKTIQATCYKLIWDSEKNEFQERYELLTNIRETANEQGILVRKYYAVEDEYSETIIKIEEEMIEAWLNVDDDANLKQLNVQPDMMYFLIYNIGSDRVSYYGAAVIIFNSEAEKQNIIENIDLNEYELYECPEGESVIWPRDCKLKYEEKNE